jgi:acetoacetyl-CoA reductase
VDPISTRRLGQPDEVAYAVQFLLDDRAGYVTGAILQINGGLEV